MARTKTSTRKSTGKNGVKKVVEESLPSYLKSSKSVATLHQQIALIDKNQREKKEEEQKRNLKRDFDSAIWIGKRPSKKNHISIDIKNEEDEDKDEEEGSNQEMEAAAAVKSLEQQLLSYYDGGKDYVRNININEVLCPLCSDNNDDNVVKDDGEIMYKRHLEFILLQEALFPEYEEVFINHENLSL